VNPRTITVEENPSYPKTVAEMKKNAKLWCLSRLRQVKYLNNTDRTARGLFAVR